MQLEGRQSLGQSGRLMSRQPGCAPCQAASAETHAEKTAPEQQAPLNPCSWQCWLQISMNTNQEHGGDGRLSVLRGKAFLPPSLLPSLQCHSPRWATTATCNPPCSTTASRSRDGACAQLSPASARRDFTERWVHSGLGYGTIQKPAPQRSVFATPSETRSKLCKALWAFGGTPGQKHWKIPGFTSHTVLCYSPFDVTFYFD